MQREPVLGLPVSKMRGGPLFLEPGHFGGNNVEQQLLPLIPTACRGHSGVNKSPFRASQVVRGMPECSLHLRF
jgi:hypothetical protein